MILLVGALLGLISVALGAYAEHGLRGSLAVEDFRALMTALRYNQFHAAVIVALALGARGLRDPWTRAALSWDAWVFAAGTALFCFSIYLSVMLDAPALTAAAPLGGLALMGAWAGLAVIAVRSPAS